MIEVNKMSDRYVVEKERQKGGLDYQVVLSGYRFNRNIICFCYYEHEAQLIADALSAQYKKGSDE